MTFGPFSLKQELKECRKLTVKGLFLILLSVKEKGSRSVFLTRPFLLDKCLQFPKLVVTLGKFLVFFFVPFPLSSFHLIFPNARASSRKRRAAFLSFFLSPFPCERTGVPKTYWDLSLFSLFFPPFAWRRNRIGCGKASTGTSFSLFFHSFSLSPFSR